MINTYVKLLIVFGLTTLGSAPFSMAMDIPSPMKQLVLIYSIDESNVDKKSDKLADMLRHSPIKRLNLGTINLNMHQCEAVALAISKAPSLQNISMERVNLPDAGFQRILGEAANLPDLHVLWLTEINVHNHTDINECSTLLGDEHARMISWIIKKQPKLEDLDLSDNEISEEGAMAIHDAMQFQTSLWNVHFKNNPFSRRKGESAQKINSRADFNRHWQMKSPCRSARYTRQVPTLKAICLFAIGEQQVLGNPDFSAQALSAEGLFDDLMAEIPQNH